MGLVIKKGGVMRKFLWLVVLVLAVVFSGCKEKEAEAANAEVTGVITEVASDGSYVVLDTDDGQVVRSLWQRRKGQQKHHE